MLEFLEATASASTISKSCAGKSEAAGAPAGLSSHLQAQPTNLLVCFTGCRERLWNKEAYRCHDSSRSSQILLGNAWSPAGRIPNKSAVVSRKLPNLSDLFEKALKEK